GLDLTTAEGFLDGGESGALVSKENPGESLLLRVAGYEDRLKMPPTGKLKDQELADLKTWVEAGAPWPGAAAVTAEEKRSAPHQFTDDEKNFWAFQPVRSPEPPAVKNEAWAKSAIDRFILAKLEEKGLEPAGPTDKLTLLRRVTYDLTGLPPTETEIKEFLADTSPDAYKRVVERLLASPRYGEKWGRHWLDIARYADSTGNDEDHRYPYAWRYRDYVIEAFNKDLPYDQFVREQIAGDLLPAAEPGEVNRRGIVATGFLALGPKAIAQQDKKKMLYDVYDEQLDVMSKAIMGVTVACARCHDHKFDPFLTKDYYSLISIFASTKSFQDPTTHVAKLLYTPLVPEEEYEKYTRHQEKVDLKAIEIEDLTDEQLEKRASELIPRLAEYMVAARRVYAGGSDASAVAKEQKLREDVLVKWVKYLKPTGESRIHLEQWHAAAPEKAAEVAQTYEAAFEKQFTAWSERLAKWRVRFRKMSAEKNMPPPPRPKFEASKDRFFHEVYFEGPFSVSKDEREKVFSEEARARLAQLKKEHEQLKAALPPEPDMACAVQAGKIVDQKVFIRGDYHSLGEEAPKGFPLILAGDELPAITEGSGRLELAKWLTQPEHPLTSRVMANRIWLGHFGEGIVRTPDNFGKMGERPTHPELLDYLASQFVENGWSVKSMHRMILLSNTYQMSSEIADRSMEADPENKLFSRFPRRRLTVEEIRDGLLAIDNSINLTMGGTLQKGFGTDKENSDDRLSLRPETNRRRMVYLPLRRANLPTLLNLFDFGDATVSSGKRALTTVAPQALFMMNSDFVEERSKNLSKLVLSESDDASARLRRLYIKILNRMPEPEEIDAGLTYVSSFQQKFAPKRTEADAWFSLSRILIASNDFIYLD
ncbi:MAG: PSD1 and planctomycete cytochrome C domain-containing protein, partial [Bryobacteraceae bacterium]